MSVEVYSIGKINIDVCLRVDQLPRQEGHWTTNNGCISAGGSAANFASQMARLGVKTGLISCVGNDSHGQEILRDLSKVGVDTSNILVLENQPTGVFVTISDKAGKQIVIAQPGANKFVEKHILDETLLGKATVIHMTSGFPIMAKQAAEIATRNGIIFSYDPGHNAENMRFGDILPHTDLLFVNERELRTYLGIEPKEQQLRSFAKTFPGILVVKLGEKGAIATDGFEYCKSQAFPVDVVDTLGAGDSFAAGFITAWSRSERIEQALHMANSVAALTIQKRGAQNGQPTLDDAASLLAKHNVSINPILRTFRPKKRRRK
ncbi:MAG: carbohydrate kinase family protein [Candidatus Thorarchaeota archaeon]